MYSIIFQFTDSASGSTFVIQEQNPINSKAAIDKWSTINEFCGYSSFSAIIKQTDIGELSKKTISFEEVEAQVGSNIELAIRQARCVYLKSCK